MRCFRAILFAFAIYSVAPATAISHESRFIAGDPVVLAPFANAAGDALFDGTLDWALRDELGASPYINVLPAASPIGQPCAQGRPRSVVAGRISKQGAEYLIVLSARTCNGAETLATATSIATRRDEVLSAMSRAVTTLRAKLGESSASLSRFAAPAEDASVRLDVLKKYSTAVVEGERNGGPPTIPLLKRVIAADPTFPPPYAALSTIYHNLQEPALSEQFATEAFRLRDRVSEREKLRIATAYFLATGQLGAEIQSYKTWQAEYPHDFVPYNDLGNDYAAIGRLSEALEEYNEGLQLEPTSIGYVNVGGMYVSLNRFDDAKRTFREALDKHFDGRYLRMSLYWLAFLQNDPPGMTRQLQWAAAEPDANDALLSEQSDTEAYDGRMASARRFSQRAVDAAVRSGSKESAALWRINEALRDAETGNRAIARGEVRSALALSSGRDVTVIAAFTLARVGDGGAASAVADRLERTYRSDSLLEMYWLPTIRAAIALDDGEPARAIALLVPVRSVERGSAGTFVSYLYPAYVRGEAYLQHRDGAKAAAEFEKVLNGKGIVQNFVTGALAHLELARAYACDGKPSDAKAEYERFFAIWKRADPDVPIFVRARDDVSQLSEQTRPAQCR